MTNINVKVKILDDRLTKEFSLPSYATEGSAGVDLRAMLKENTILKAHQSMLVNTGIAIYIGDPNVCATVLPRSGLGFKHGIVLGNLTGLIDSDYQGELLVPLWNRSDNDFEIKVGDRIAQMVFLPILKANLQVVDTFDKTLRSEGGFGSTGL